MNWLAYLILFTIPMWGFSISPGLSCSGSILYWKASEQGLGFTNKPANILTTDNFTENSIRHPKFQWDLGFRFQLDYTNHCLPWSFQGFWTYLKSKAHGHRSYSSGEPDFQGIYPVWSMGPDSLASDYASSASSHWDLRTNILDLNAQYLCPYFIEHLTVYPFIGLRAAVLNQKLDAKYEGGIFYSGTDYNTLKNHYIGAGPRLGVNIEYGLQCGFSVFGRAALAPLFGRFHIKQKETYLDNVLLHRSKTSHKTVLSADYCIGLRWAGTLWEYRDFCFDIAWEGQEFYQANQFFRGDYHFFSKNRSLLLQGFTLSASLGF